MRRFDPFHRGATWFRPRSRASSRFPRKTPVSKTRDKAKSQLSNYRLLNWLFALVSPVSSFT
ncbi:MAG TPA: hypothetical protein VKV40_00575 [Ktedonobacteraceae bacterium]|nr:hypothetical protein [Ktedonobacteraceae bacterium]